VFCSKSAHRPCAPLVNVGDAAPPFSARDQNDREVRLEDLLRRGPVVLYFYPKDFTKVCTDQACLFRDAAARWKDATIVGVSVDSDESHQKFAECNGLSFALLSDRDRSIAKSYDVLRFFGAFTKRVTFVIDPDGIVRGVFHHELSAEKHVRDVDGLLAQLA
jgi:peroxiredoxin Q/BCP